MEKLGPKVKWLKKMRSDPNTRKLDALYEFHQERGHKTKDCIALRQEVVNAMEGIPQKETGEGSTLPEDVNNINDRPPSPTRTIHMIIEGGNDASINSVKFTTTYKLKRSITHERYDELEESIIFAKSDINGLVLTHYDALVITLQILYTDVRRIMVDDGSGT
ncbi:uncharacterized protein [Nicotiana tomentosiformis]|uniref:uncharacterized protein n=1 Tax=Nicotiana tomentosiformis TaxID=4098 RepID=UPI00388C396E